MILFRTGSFVYSSDFFDTEGSVNQTNAHGHFFVIVRVKSNNATLAVKTLLHHWIVEDGHPNCVVTDPGSVDINVDMTQFSLLWVHNVFVDLLVPLSS